jgi:single-strand DNA-binding protein
MLNRVVLIGRLTRDPELIYTPSGVAVSKFTLACDRKFKNAQGEREADFIPCVVYRQLAELVANYLAKGKLCAVDGRIQTRNYTNNDGQKVWVTEIIAEDVRFLSPKEHTEASNSGAERTYGPDNRTYGNEVSLDDDIPF